MSVAMTSCGAVGWVTDRTGYRYNTLDPLTGRRWPAMPSVLSELAAQAAQRGGFARFEPDAFSLTGMNPDHACLCTRIKTNTTTGSRSCPCHWDCRPCFCSAARVAMIAPPRFRWDMAMSSCGAARRDCGFTA